MNKQFKKIICALIFCSFVKNMDCARIGRKKKHGFGGGTGTILLCSQSCQTNPGWRQFLRLTRSTTSVWQVTREKKAGNCDSDRNYEELRGLPPFALLGRQPTGQWTPPSGQNPNPQPSRILILSQQFWLRGQFLTSPKISQCYSETKGDQKIKENILLFFMSKTCFQNDSVGLWIELFGYGLAVFRRKVV